MHMCVSESEFSNGIEIVEFLRPWVTVFTMAS